ncbi:MAG: hypothetical protein KAG66_17685, partial [Methylococcales bacterium]|nr:hypothetical protein [Methylococcales bacterium]
MKMTYMKLISAIGLSLCLLLGSLRISAEDTKPIEPTLSEPTIVITAELTPVTTKETATRQPSATPDYSGDRYEPDSFTEPLVYTGRIQRSFNPINDVDYIALRIKPGLTIFQTDRLSGAADTQLTLYDRQAHTILAVNDDADGLASQISFESDRTLDVVVQ